MFLNSRVKLLTLNKSTLLTMAKFTSMAMANCILVGICSSNSDSSVKEQNTNSIRKYKEWKNVLKNDHCTGN